MGLDLFRVICDNPSHMTILCSLEAIALTAVLAISFWRERLHRQIMADLLDRVMARSYGEYVTSTKTLNRPLRRKVLSDEEMAEMERQAAGIV